MNKAYYENLKGDGKMVRTMTVVVEEPVKLPGRQKAIHFWQVLEANGITQPLHTEHLRFGRYSDLKNGRYGICPTSVSRYPIAVFDDPKLAIYLPSAKLIGPLIRSLPIGTVRKYVFGTSEFTFEKHNLFQFSFTWKGIAVKPGTNIVRQGKRTAIISIDKWIIVAGLLLNDLKKVPVSTTPDLSAR